MSSGQHYAYLRQLEGAIAMAKASGDAESLAKAIADKKEYLVESQRYVAEQMEIEMNAPSWADEDPRGDD